MLRGYYKKGAHGATLSTDDEAQANGELAALDPAPHPTRSTLSRAEWSKGYQANGPVEVLMNAIHHCGAKLNDDFEILMFNEAPIGILDTPYQFLNKAVLAMHARVRTKAAQGCRELNSELNEIDVKASLGMQSKMPKEDVGYVHTIQNASGWGKTQLEQIGAAENSHCDLCGQELQNTGHSIWNCCKLEKARIEADPELAQIDPEDLHSDIKRGIAPAMGTQPESTFWGSELKGSRTEQMKTLLGYRKAPTECSEARNILVHAKTLGCNARQLIAVCRGGFGQGGAPKFPEDVQGRPGKVPDTFTDGSVKNPTDQAWALGGF